MTTHPRRAQRGIPAVEWEACEAHVKDIFGPPQAGDRGWVLIDTGLAGMRGRIENAAAARFGEGARPAAIIMTHGHSDHAGCLVALANEWDAPIYAHRLEHPFLNGHESYPPPDTTVGGGLMPSKACTPRPWKFPPRNSTAPSRPTSTSSWPRDSPATSPERSAAPPAA